MQYFTKIRNGFRNSTSTMHQRQQLRIQRYRRNGKICIRFCQFLKKIIQNQFWYFSQIFKQKHTFDNSKLNFSSLEPALIDTYRQHDTMANTKPKLFLIFDKKKYKNFLWLSTKTKQFHVSSYSIRLTDWSNWLLCAQLITYALYAVLTGLADSKQVSHRFRMYL